jgi:hypothetical protein
MRTYFNEYKHLLHRLQWLESEGKSDSAEADDLHERIEEVMGLLSESEVLLAKKLQRDLTSRSELR